MSIRSCIPQSDMDCYYNHVWKRSHKLTNNKTLINNFTIIQDEIDSEMYKFIMNATIGHDPVLNNLVMMRNSYFDRNIYSGSLIKLIKLVVNISSVSDLANVIRFFNNVNVTTLFCIYVIPHFKIPDVYVFALGEISLTFESIEKYDDLSPDLVNKFINILDDVYKYITEHWNYNLSTKTNFIKNIITFEILFSKSNLSSKESMNPIITHNSIIYEIFLKLFDTNNFWRIILDGYMSDDMYIFYENKTSLLFIKYFLKTIQNNELIMIKDYLIYCLYKKYNIVTDHTKSNTKNNDPLIEILYQTFGYYLQSVYESKYCDCQKNTDIHKMFINMKSYIINVFNESNIFKNHKTKLNALKKIESLDIIIGKQNYSVDLSELPILSNNIFDNLMLIDSFYFNKKISLIGKPINKHYLAINDNILSFTLNAYYEQLSNIIYVPTSITNDILFKLNVDPIYNYGSLGAIIGHEMMHCFDNNGAQFDFAGHLNNWWSENDYNEYNSEIMKIKNHYSGLILNDIKYNSELSFSENIADIAGLKLSLRTYIKIYMSCTNPNKLLDNEKQHLKIFFERWAHTLRTVDDIETTNQLIKFVSHSPNIIRINAPFSHINEYYQIYNVKPEHQNYLSPNLRTKFLDV